MGKIYPLLILFVVFLTSGCTVIESIFEAGIWAGIIVVILVLAGTFIIYRLIKRAGKK